MTNQWICLGLVAVAYLLGHATGYRLCKLRAKNMLRKLMMSHLVSPNYADAYARVLSAVMKL